MHHDHRTARRVVTGLAAGAVLSSALAAGATASAAEQRPAATVETPAQQALVLDQLTLLLAPLLSGLGQVGELLSVSQPEWSLPGVSTDIAWLCNGEKIPGSEGFWSYVPTEAQQGCLMAAQVTGTLLGFLPLEYVTNALQIPFLGQEEQTPQATSAPTVSGTPKLGSPLTASDPQWDTSVDSTAYQWLRGGQPIAGATAKSYTPRAEDVGKQVAVKVTATKGSASGTATSQSVLVQPGDAATATTPVRISGQPRVGSTLEALDPTWSAVGVSTSFQWLRDGATIPGATGRSYLVSASDVGSALSVRATGSRTGYAPGSSTSQAVTVTRGSSTTRATLASKRVSRAQRAVLKVVVAVRGGGIATGKVQVLDGRRPLKAYPLRATDRGRASLTLPRLAPGKHRLKVTYTGSAAVAGSSSKAVVLTVRR